MTPDIRISIDFWKHHKTVKLERRLGLEAIRSLTMLWMWAAQNRPDGDLSGMDDEAIEISAEWNSDKPLIEILAELGWIDGEPMSRSIHNWKKRNPWAASSDKRSNAGRLNRFKQDYPEIHALLLSQGFTGLTEEERNLLIDTQVPFKQPLSTTQAVINQIKNSRRVSLGHYQDNAEADTEQLSGNTQGIAEVDVEQVLGNTQGNHEVILDNTLGSTQVAVGQPEVTGEAQGPAPAPAPAPAPKDKDKNKKNTPLIPPEGDGPEEPVPERPPSKRPLEGVPYDTQAFPVIYEMLDYCNNYVPDAPSEIRLLQELAQEYPRVNLVAEFRKARDWLINAPPSKRPKSDLPKFLRKWVSTAVNKYGVGQPRIIGVETKTVFVPADNGEGGGQNAGQYLAET
jgi:hypothetical protein